MLLTLFGWFLENVQSVSINFPHESSRVYQTMGGKEPSISNSPRLVSLCSKQPAMYGMCAALHKHVLHAATMKIFSNQHWAYTERHIYAHSYNVMILLHKCDQIPKSFLQTMRLTVYQPSYYLLNSKVAVVTTLTSAINIYRPKNHSNSTADSAKGIIEVVLMYWTTSSCCHLHQPHEEQSKNNGWSTN